jgi:predicted nucleic acid-binding protein
VSRIFFDTNLFIYMVEEAGERAARIRGILERMSKRHDELLTSTLTLGEVLVKPLESNDESLADQYEKLLSSPGVSVLPFDRDSARIYARLRRDRGLKSPDAIQLACAASARCDMFLTNDDRLSKKIVPGIQFIVSLDQAFV